MEKLKTFSCKLKPSDIAKIDECVRRHRYWKRNTIIKGILHSIIQNATDEQILEFVRWDEKYFSQINFSIEYEHK